MALVSVVLFDDRKNEKTNVVVTTGLANLFSYAHQWALQENRSDQSTLSFSSMLAALIAGADPLCAWLRSHLSLRGVHADSMTKGRRINAQPLPGVLNTTISFRRALAKARELCPSEQDSGVAVRHFMAAYAVIPAYHIGDFLRLRIDRRAWCLELAGHLVSKFPEEEETWLKYARETAPVPSLGFNTDAPEGRDLLNIDREIEAFARLIASRNTSTPLSVGVFGAWGSGKSFFMRRLRRRVAGFARLGEAEGAKSKYHGRIAQIDFNAWHYSEGNLAASFVDHIFRNLRIAPDETAEDLRERGEALIKQLDTAKQELAIRQKAVADAEIHLAGKQQAIVDLEQTIGARIEAKKAEIASARTGVQDAQNKLAEALSALQAEIEAELKKVPAAVAANLFLKRLDSREFSEASHNVSDLIAEARAAGKRRKLILYGLIVVATGAAATAVMGSALYTKLIAAAATVGSLAGTAGIWLRKLNAFGEIGREFEEEQTKIKGTIIAEVTAARESVVAGLRTAAANQLTVVETLGAQLKEIEDSPVSARLALDDLEGERASALAQYAEAAAAVEKKKTELARLTTGTLLEEFLDDRLSTDGYLKELTIFSRIRNDFERLSELMTKSYEDYVAGKVLDPPAVSRIVLYIDDLDRCPADRVVEVLKLVHLLLAFPLFVCVAAVDPRWITWCLQKAPGLIGPKDESELAAEFGERANASDYLEKIFQIPLWLRPVPSEYRAAIARTLLDPSESEVEPWVDMPIVASRDTVVTSPAKREGPEGEGDAPGSAIDPDMITLEELNYLDELAGLLGGNPRSLKRFVNTYRLVKTALSDVELASFLQPSTADGSWTRNRANAYLPYRICMAQLAVLCTQRNRALRLVRHADTAAGDTSLTEWLNQFRTIDADLAERFQSALANDLDGANVDTFKRWLERTRRYSFYL